MLGQRTLLVNPPLVNGVAFTRQGRCQEREEVLGTTKPPYTLALIAALLRAHGCEIRLVDLTADRKTSGDLIAQLDAEGGLELVHRAWSVAQVALTWSMTTLYAGART